MSARVHWSRLRNLSPKELWAYRVGLVAWVVLAGTISLSAYLGRLPSVRWIQDYDYLLHAALVGPLALWLDGALGFRDVRRLPLGPVVVATFASTEEYLQRFSALRSSTWHDLLGNLIGVVVYACLGRALRRARSSPARR